MLHFYEVPAISPTRILFFVFRRVDATILGPSIRRRGGLSIRFIFHYCEAPFHKFAWRHQSLSCRITWTIFETASMIEDKGYVLLFLHYIYHPLVWLVGQSCFPFQLLRLPWRYYTEIDRKRYDDLPGGKWMWYQSWMPPTMPWHNHDMQLHVKSRILK